MKNYRIYDHVEKSVVYDIKTGTESNGFRDMKVLEFNSRKSAEQHKYNYLDAGNYPDKPHTVLEVILA